MIIINNGVVHYCHIFSVRENSSYCIKKEKAATSKLKKS